MAPASKAIYSIGAVARMLGVPTPTLRAWEERYRVVVPGRGDGTQRLYTREEVERLRFIKGQIDIGLSASDAHRLLEDELAAGDLMEGGDRGRALAPSVLIAERDPYAAELAEYFLKTEGYEVRTALDASGARALFDQDAPQLVVLDLLLSGGAGFRLCREFSESGPVQVLAVSALDSADEALTDGASAFLQKPVEPLELVSTVRDLFRTSALTRAGSPVSETRPAGIWNER